MSSESVGEAAFLALAFAAAAVPVVLLGVLLLRSDRLWLSRLEWLSDRLKAVLPDAVPDARALFEEGDATEEVVVSFRRRMDAASLGLLYLKQGYQ